MCAHVTVPLFRAREARAAEGSRRQPPKAARAPRAQEKGDHNMGAGRCTYDKRTPYCSNFKSLPIESGHDCISQMHGKKTGILNASARFQSMSKNH